LFYSIERDVASTVCFRASE